MKRKGFILTEILTGMMLQVGFALVLCSAFYMILNFSTNAQQGFAANDKGQVVISYFDSRIRNAGLGLWGCHGSKDIRLALDNIPALNSNHKELCLPVAIMSSADGKVDVSYDKRTKVYSGNVVTLLYARKDTNETGGDPVRLILLTNKAQSSKDVTSGLPNTSTNRFDLIDHSKNSINSYTASEFWKDKGDGTYSNIRHYAVLEGSGVPLYTQTVPSPNQIGLMAPSTAGLNPVTVYPMSELLNLECQRLYTKQDDNGYNFVFQELNNYGNWGNPYYHTKDILDLYMTLDTKPTIPIFELRVLVCEGINEYGTTPRPKDWPGKWTADFSRYKVHVSKATWKLYNLAPQFAD